MRFAPIDLQLRCPNRKSRSQPLEIATRSRNLKFRVPQKECGKRSSITFFVFGTLSVTFRSLFLTLLSLFSSLFAKLLFPDSFCSRARNRRALCKIAAESPLNLLRRNVEIAMEIASDLGNKDSQKKTSSFNSKNKATVFITFERFARIAPDLRFAVLLPRRSDLGASKGGVL